MPSFLFNLLNFRSMPIIKSAKKALRQAHKNEDRNTYFKMLYRESRINFEKAIKAQDIKEAKEVFVGKKDKDGKTTTPGLQSNIDKLVKKNIIKKNNGSRKKSQFAKQLKTLELSLKS